MQHSRQLFGQCLVVPWGRDYCSDGPMAWVLRSGRENISRAALLFCGDIPVEMLSVQHEVHELTCPLVAAPC